jgi:hypothetical protein
MLMSTDTTTTAIKRKRPEKTTRFEYKPWLMNNRLDINSVITYFSLSEFYNKNSLQHKIFTGELTAEQIKNRRGIIYRIEEPTNQPPSHPPRTFPMFIIHEELQVPNEPNEPIAVYYVSDGCISKSPSIYEILRTRVDKAKQKIEKALSFLSERAKFDPAKEWYWEEKMLKEEEEEGEEGEEVKPKPKKKHRRK